MKKEAVMGIIAAFIILSLFITGCIKSTTSPQPGTFGIKIYADFTSSGASRNYNATLAFIEGKLVDGWSKYVSDDINGIHIEHECVADLSSMTWIDAKTNQTCDDSLKIISPGEGIENVFVPLTKEGIQKIIDGGTLKPAEKCLHGDICYDLLPAL
jgi:hypothetical protein